MIKKIIPILIIITVLVGFYLITSQKPVSTEVIPTPDSDIVLFYGETCPHCKDVEAFISANKIDEKLKINKFEVYNSKANATLMAQMVKDNCSDQASPEGIPVPFLINSAEKKCFIGTPDITGYLTEKSK